MDKLKSMLSPGKHTDDENLYKSSDPSATGTGQSQSGPSGNRTQTQSSQYAQGGANPSSNIQPGQTRQPVASQATGTSGQGISQQAAGKSGGQSNTAQHSKRDAEKPARQSMPGKFPSGNSVMESHNPYTSHELDPRIGGSTTEEPPKQEWKDNRNEPTQELESHPPKGLNAARKEDYSQESRLPDRTDTDKLTSNAPFIAGGAAATAAALAATRNDGNDFGGNQGAASTNQYAGTTASGSDSNYYGAPTGTAVAETGQSSYPQNEGAANTFALPGMQGYPPREPIAEGNLDQQSYSGEQYPSTAQDNQNDSTFRNTAIGAGAAGVGAQQYRQHASQDQQSGSYAQNDSGAASQRGMNENVSGTNAGYEQQQQPYSGEQSYSQTHNKNDHTLRNTAIGAGAAGVGAHQYREHKKADDQYGNYTGNEGQRGTNESVSGTNAGQQSYSGNQYSSQTQDDRNDHTLRNTAIGAGVAGVGAHQYREHKKEDDQYGNYAGQGTPAASQSTATGNYGTTPAATTSTTTSNYAGSDARGGSQSTTTGNSGLKTTESADKHDHSYSKGAAAAGAGGLAATQLAGKRSAEHDTRDTTATDREVFGDRTSHDKTTTSEEQTKTSGPHHKSSLLNKLDPHVKNEKSPTATTTAAPETSESRNLTKESDLQGYDAHGNRETVAGAAMLGAAGNERYQDRTHGVNDPPHQTGHTGGASHHVNLPEGVELPRGNDFGKDVKDPRYGLPMGVAGLTAEEAEELRRGKNDPLATQPDNDMKQGMRTKHDEKHDAKHDERDAKHGTTKEKKRRSSILGFLHRDKNKKYSKEEEEEFDRQEREHHARTGAAGVAAAGTGAYAASQINKPLPPDPSQQNQATTAQTSDYATQGQQTDLADRTRRPDTTSATASNSGVVDRDGAPLDSRGATGSNARDEVPAGRYAGANTGTSTAAYLGDGRDYPVGGTERATEQYGSTRNQKAAGYGTGLQSGSTGYNDGYQQPQSTMSGNDYQTGQSTAYGSDYQQDHPSKYGDDYQRGSSGTYGDDLQQGGSTNYGDNYQQGDSANYGDGYSNTSGQRDDGGRLGNPKVAERDGHNVLHKKSHVP